MVGQYQGPTGTAALAVVAPVWNIIYSLGLLTGIGGSVLLSTMRGQAAGSEKRSNEYFSAAVIGTVILAALAWAGLLFFDRPLLTLFGAEETLLPLARAYLFPIKFAVPSFLFTQLMSAFLRNDGDPALATKAMLFGGIFNVFGDYFFVFTLDMGIMGAGIATAMGSVFSLIIMLTHFFRKKNTLHPCEWIFPFCARSAGSGCPGASAPKPSQSKCRRIPPAQEVPAGHRGGVPPRDHSCFVRPFRCLWRPIPGAPMGKVPLLHIGIALVVDVVERSAAGDKVGGIVVDVQPRRVQAAAHGLHLSEPAGVHPSRFKQFCWRLLLAHSHL